MRENDWEVVRFRPFAAEKPAGWRRIVFPDSLGWIDVRIEAKISSGPLLKGVLRIRFFRNRPPEFTLGPDHQSEQSLLLHDMQAIATQYEQWEEIGRFVWQRLGVWIPPARQI